VVTAEVDTALPDGVNVAFRNALGSTAAAPWLSRNRSDPLNLQRIPERSTVNSSATPCPLAL